MGSLDDLVYSACLPTRAAAHLASKSKSIMTSCHLLNLAKSRSGFFGKSLRVFENP
jgi:hypothetical protein